MPAKKKIIPKKKPTRSISRKTTSKKKIVSATPQRHTIRISPWVIAILVVAVGIFAYDQQVVQQRIGDSASEVIIDDAGNNIRLAVEQKVRMEFAEFLKKSDVEIDSIAFASDEDQGMIDYTDSLGKKHQQSFSFGIDENNILFINVEDE